MNKSLNYFFLCLKTTRGSGGNSVSEQINSLIEIEKLFMHFQSTRSVLYSLEPIGIGTPYVESLTSYITRLAAKHNVRLSSLMINVIAPNIKIGYLKNKLQEGSVISKDYLLNGIGKTSIEFIRTLNKLTGRNDLQYTTMSSWTGIFSKNITAHNRRWCPDCLKRFKTDSIEAYEPLIWCISDIKKCDLHNTDLQEECPKCQRKLPLMHSNLKVGHCQYCHTWLGEGASSRNCEPITRDEKFIMDNYKQLIEKAPELISLPIRYNISNVLLKIKEGLGFSSISKMSKFLEVNNPTLCTWINNQSLPTPKSLLGIAVKVQCTLFEMISGKKIGPIEIISEAKISKKSVSKEDLESHLKKALNTEMPKSLNEISREGGFSHEAAENNFPILCKLIKDKYNTYHENLKIERQLKLERALIDCLNLEIPISLKDCLLQCGVPPTTAKRHYPDLCMKVVLRYKEYVTNQAKERDAQLSKEIENIMLELNAKGIYPSQIEINKLISKPGILRAKKYKELRKRILLTLGHNL